jgi:hypothetical protein
MVAPSTFASTGAALARYVGAEQERLGRYEVDLYPEPGSFRVRRGEIIGYTGESGAGPPHLHFEIRNGAGDVATNPLLAGYVVADHRAPTVRDITVSPAGPRSLVDGRPFPHRLKVREVRSGEYLTDTTRVSGPVAFSVHVYDRADGKRQRLAVHQLSLSVAGDTLYASSLDSVPYVDQRQVDLVYDSARAQRGQPRVRRLYRPPGSDLHVHRGGEGVVLLEAGADGEDPFRLASAEGSSDSPVIVARIEATDFFGNRALVRIPLIVSSAAPPVPVAAPSAAHVDGTNGQGPALLVVPESGPGWCGLTVSAASGLQDIVAARLRGDEGEIDGVLHPLDDHRLAIRFEPGEVRGPVTLALEGSESAESDTTLELSMRCLAAREASDVSWDGASLRVGEGNLFADDCLWASIETIDLDLDDGLTQVSPVVALGPAGLAFRGWADLSLEPQSNDLGRVGMYVSTSGKQWFFVGQDRADGRIRGRIGRLARFCLIRDEAPPEFRGHRPPDGGAVGDRRPVVAVRISDTGSGLHWSNLELTLDDEPLIAEWDREAKELRGRPLRPLAPGAHTVVATAEDRVGNRSRMSFSFRVASP